MLDDSLFDQYAAEQQKEAEEKANRSNNSYSKEYVQIKWTGLETNNTKIVRAVGGPPDSKIDNHTAKTTRVAWIIGDDGKKFRCILPEAADAPDHLLWNIISRVKRSEWIEGKRTNPVEESAPEIFNMVNKNGLDKSDKSFIFDKGWTGRHILLMNVIDREMMEWHRENKHTALLSRAIGIGKDGTEFPEIGVPSYGFLGSLGNLFKFYKSWEKYDIGITRTGLKEAPYRVINASKYIEEVGEAKAGLVSSEPLTDEERSWEQYDLNELFKFTSYTKIYNHLKGKIARIDAALDTNFLSELKFLVDKEKAEWEGMKADETKAEMGITESHPTTPVEESKAPTQETPTRQRNVVRSEGDLASIDFGITQLSGYDGMTQEEKDAIKSVDCSTNPPKITYVDANQVVLACPECSVPSPETFHACPNCGIEF